MTSDLWARVSDAEAPPSIPSELESEWEFVRHLKRGGQAWPMVVRRRCEPNDEAIVKLPRQHLEESAKRRIEREVVALRAVSHPNVISVLHAGKVAGCSYYMMPVGGVGKDFWREKRETLGPFDLVDVAIQQVQAILGGLSELHRRGFIHRDIKPENLVTIDSQPVIIDLGLVKTQVEDGLTKQEGRDLGNRFQGQPRYPDRPWSPSDDCLGVAWLLGWMLAEDPQQSFGAYDGRYHSFVDEPRTELVRTWMVECTTDDTCPRDAAEFGDRIKTDLERWGAPTGQSLRSGIDAVLQKQREDGLRARRARAARLQAVDAANRRIEPVVGGLQKRLLARFQDDAANGLHFANHQPWWRPPPEPLRAVAENPSEMSPVFDFRC